ncbi:MAG: diaminopimelate epimerase [Propionibacteriaceae bacterium]|jgi:diaminopimelate epimerase|nr:diaminopimelate epimerase [Propionibacteriaceae bacterium]
MRTWLFAKGHGTHNDFVLINDRSGMLNPSDEDVRFLCDRRAGIGADGFLRAVKAEQLWFMDYRNADGSIAEMCGNGLRVFVKWLMEQDLVSGDTVDIATRAGIRHARTTWDGSISVTMGVPTWDMNPVTVTLGDRDYSGHPVDVGNPHCVVMVDSVEELNELDLTSAVHSDHFPEGVNVEFVTIVGDSHLKMRVLERGVGETMSCGTGVVAAALNERMRTSTDHPDTLRQAKFKVDVPGGRLKVEFDDQGEAQLIGPAVIIARGEVILPHG